MIQAFKMMQSLSEKVEREDDSLCFSGFVIAKNSRFKLYWDLFASLLMLISYFMVPYQIAFGGPRGDNAEDFISLEIILDIIILIDVCINFITDSYSDPGETITNRQIAYRYITSYFVPDVIAFLPGLVTNERYGGFTTIYKLKLFRYLKAKRLVN